MDAIPGPGGDGGPPETPMKPVENVGLHLTHVIQEAVALPHVSGLVPVPDIAAPW